MATYEEAYKHLIISRDGKNVVADGVTVVTGKTQEEKIYPYQIKIETDQKCVKPTISIHGNSADGMIEELGTLYDKIVKEFQDKRKKAVAPITAVESTG